MALSQTKTFKDLQDAVISEGKLADNTTVRDEVKRKINDAYAELGFEEDYSWSGITRSFLLKGTYTTGTISVTNGSPTVTGSSTVWTSLDHKGWKLYVTGQTSPYTVRYVASNTSLTLDRDYLGDTTSGISYTLYKDEYGMFPDADALRWLYIPGFSSSGRLVPSGPDEFDGNRFGQPFASGRPRLVTTSGKNVYRATTWSSFKFGDYWESPETTATYDYRQTNMLIWPAIFENDLIAHIRYTRKLSPMGADTDEPLVPLGYRNILVYRPLIRNFLKQRDLKTRREVKDELKKLEKMLKADIDVTSDSLTMRMDRRHHGRRSNIYATNNFTRS